jgi:formylglycine-generating enzyme required for sulfatase activity
MPQHLRVFISSPGDVADERHLALDLLKNELPYDPFLRGKITLDPVSWDDPAAPIPMVATLTPQEAVNHFGWRPSECDILIVVLWSRLGTHLQIESTPYLSGTEYEYEEAVNAERPPEILVYRRTERVPIYADDSKFDDTREQYQKAQAFFDRFKNPDGSCRGGFTNYETPTDFVSRLGKDLKTILRKRLEAANKRIKSDDESPPPPAVVVKPVWTSSPYPGLRPFTTEEAAIFFGRGREVDNLIARLRDPTQRFLAVVGTSGTGKSSLIRAGLIPRLHDGAIEGSQDWRVIACTPGATGDNPFLALAVGLAGVLPAHAQKPPIEIATALSKSPQRISEFATLMASGAVVLFVDQLEELFVPAIKAYYASFGALLAHAVAHPQVRVVATLRADFLPQCMTLPDLAPLIQAPAAIFPLAPPGPIALADMIRKPAERAGLELEDGLADEILKDAGADPGALPMMAFCLEELYQQNAGGHRLTLDAYKALGRLRGAIGRRATALLKELHETEGVALDTALPQLFRALVHVDAVGTATRRRAFLDELGETAPISPIVDKLVKGRLLAAENADDRATITLAHEALLQEWPALRVWLDRHIKQHKGRAARRERLQLLAREWKDRKGFSRLFGLAGWSSLFGFRGLEPGSIEHRYLRWSRGRAVVEAIVMAAVLSLVGESVYWAMVRGLPFQVLTERWVYKLGIEKLPFPALEPIPPRSLPMSFMMGSNDASPTNPECAPEEAERVLPVQPVHPVTLAGPFYLGKTEVTFREWDACVADGACDGYRPADQGWGRDERPVINVSWEHAQTYVEWLSRKKGRNCRLPSEAEWEYAARAESKDTKYALPSPDGSDNIKDKGLANCANCGSEWDNKKTAPVRKFPANSWGLHDMHGNVWEWVEDCAHKYKDEPDDGRAWGEENGGNCKNRVLRGGSWSGFPVLVRSADRLKYDPKQRTTSFGFRVVCGSP